MAASVPTTATSLEGQILELLQEANNRESTLTDELNQGRFTVALDLEGQSITVSATFDVSVTNNGGTLAIAPMPYLP